MFEIIVTMIIAAVILGTAFAIYTAHEIETETAKLEADLMRELRWNGLATR